MLFSNLKLDVSGLLRVEAGCEDDEVAENLVTQWNKFSAVRTLNIVAFKIL